MSLNTTQIGKRGEQIAVEYLQALGCQILETNWRFSRAEVDIIASHSGILLFVEVKSRSYTTFGEPEAFVTPYKERLYFDASNAYMEQINYDGEIRFDIISIVFGKQTHQVKYFKDAFFAGL